MMNEAMSPLRHFLGFSGEVFVRCKPLVRPLRAYQKSVDGSRCTSKRKTTYGVGDLSSPGRKEYKKQRNEACETRSREECPRKLVLRAEAQIPKKRCGQKGNGCGG